MAMEQISSHHPKVTGRWDETTLRNGVNEPTINNWVRAIHETAKSKGWYDEKVKKSPAEAIMLMVTELAEAVEEVRNGNPHLYFVGPNGEKIGTIEQLVNKMTNGERIHSLSMKPEGEAIELADCVIRIMDYFGYKGWDLEAMIKMKHEFNQTRSQMHGGKKF